MRVFADLWDIERLFDCACSQDRAARLRADEPEQRVPPPVAVCAVPDVDLAIVGSGFGGSILAMIARRLGLRVALLERGRHPRFAIGESSSPLAGILLEQLADRYDLPRLKPLAAFGAWQRAYPDVVCGLKRGFTYFKHEAGRPFAAARRSLEPSAGRGEPARRDLRHALAARRRRRLPDARGGGARRRVRRRGAARVARLGLPAALAVLGGRRRGAALRVDARGVVDATGPRGFLSRALALQPQALCRLSRPRRRSSRTSPAWPGATRCPTIAGAGARGEAPPYPVDDAALHHVFDGGWMWVLRFGNGVTSAGVAVVDALAEDLRAGRRRGRVAPPARSLSHRARAVRRRAGRPASSTGMPRLSYRAPAAAGPRWALLPSAAAFVDPLFSTGFPLTLLGIERLAGLLDSGAFFGEPRAWPIRTPADRSAVLARGLQRDRRSPRRITPRASSPAVTPAFRGSTTSCSTRCSTSPPRATPRWRGGCRPSGRRPASCAPPIQRSHRRCARCLRPAHQRSLARSPRRVRARAVDAGEHRGVVRAGEEELVRRRRRRRDRGRGETGSRAGERGRGAGGARILKAAGRALKTLHHASGVSRSR